MENTCGHKRCIISCRECKMKCCSKCIKSETHNCPRLDERKATERDILAKKLVKVDSVKIVQL